MAGQRITSAQEAAQVVHLKSPVEAWGEELTAVCMREPTAKDLRNVGNMVTDPLGVGLVLAERLSGLPRSTIDALKGPDALAVAGAALGFIAAGLLDGETS